jgi:pilus assembly protein Flp/PilA
VRRTNTYGGSRMKSLVTRFVNEESGQDLIEYGLLIGIITVGAIASIKLIGPKVATYFSNLNTNLP